MCVLSLVIELFYMGGGKNMDNKDSKTTPTLEELVNGMADVCSWSDLLPDYDADSLMVHYSNTSYGPF